jgi:uncharacterized membrane protein YphA (DoxX/SURF4 family)
MILPAVLITFMYFISGIDKISAFAPVSQGLAKKLQLQNWLFLAQILIVLVILLEIIAPLVIVANELYPDLNIQRWAKMACWALAGFTVLATLLYHMPPSGEHYRAFLSNMTAVGALLLLSRL